MWDEDARLVIGFQSAFVMPTTMAPDYDVISYVMCPNPQDCGNSVGAAFFAGIWGSAPALPLPFNAGWVGQAAPGIFGGLYRNANNLSIGCTVYQGVVHQLLAEAPGQGTRFFNSDDLRDCSVMFSSMPWPVTVASSLNFGHRPLRDAGVFPRAASGGVVVRRSGVYAIMHDRTSLIAFKSSDGGKSISAFAQTPIGGLGSDTIHHINVMPGQLSDPDIMGMVTVLRCTPSQWSHTACPAPPAYAANNPTATALRWSLPAS